MATIRKRGTSQWEVQIRKRGYPPQSKTFKLRAAAEAWAREIEFQMDAGAFSCRKEADRTTFRDALQRYWDEVGSQKRYSKNEWGYISRWMKHPYSSRFLSNLRGADWAKYRDDRRAEGKAENTIRIELMVVSTIYNVARTEWGMESLGNPLDNIRKPSGAASRDRRLRPGEFELIRDALSQSTNRWAKPMFEFAIETALRQGMLFKLQWDWVDR
ncbi:hypothetical protein [Herbaspirillum sp. YR522]|uniref:hypothetical protein n=1 Tax=Herbaspirillum sp. YR522 TaxID=1144342 RepID=UPI00026FA285|nr:hypothetical protein [Herbaspirillum sp. YR522]EJN06439.1 hypothetical protein PMI40_02225 [Herbaspirillum sp. YR522]